MAYDIVCEVVVNNMEELDRAHHVLDEMVKMSEEIDRNIKKICDKDSPVEKDTWRTGVPEVDEHVLIRIRDFNGHIHDPYIGRYSHVCKCWITRETGQVLGGGVGLPYEVIGWYPLPNLSLGEDQNGAE